MVIVKPKYTRHLISPYADFENLHGVGVILLSDYRAHMTDNM